MLHAMVPSTFGNWWADELPWFMPSLRYKILEQVPTTRTVFDEINRERLEQAASVASAALQQSDGDPDSNPDRAACAI